MELGELELQLCGSRAQGLPAFCDSTEFVSVQLLEGGRDFKLLLYQKI